MDMYLNQTLRFTGRLILSKKKHGIILNLLILDKIPFFKILSFNILFGSDVCLFVQYYF
jgi:hypothetical protein